MWQNIADYNGTECGKWRLSLGESHKKEIGANDVDDIFREETVYERQWTNEARRIKRIRRKLIIPYNY